MAIQVVGADTTTGKLPDVVEARITEFAAEITGPDGAPLPAGTHVQIRLTADFTDIDDIVVVED